MAFWEMEQSDSSGALRGRPLRYVLVQILHRRQREAALNRSISHSITVAELIAACRAEGVVFDRRASKLISDALRWEVARGRVVHLERGVYTYGAVPRSTLWRIDKAVEHIRDRLRSAAKRRNAVTNTAISRQVSGRRASPLAELFGVAVEVHQRV